MRQGQQGREESVRVEVLVDGTCQGPAVTHHGDLEEAHSLCVGPDEPAYPAAASASRGSPRGGFFLLVIVCSGGWVGAPPGFRLTKRFLLERWQWLGRGREGMAWGLPLRASV